MTVYRVQDKTKKGPYVGNHTIGFLEWDRAFHHEFCPGPHRDGIDMYTVERGNVVFAFPTVEALHVWFGYELIHALRGFGYDVVEYEVPDAEVIVSSSRRQCVFPTEYLR